MRSELWGDIEVDIFVNGDAIEAFEIEGGVEDALLLRVVEPTAQIRFEFLDE
jgi:hypothetical protein